MHKTVIPTLGGLGIFAGFIVAILMGVPPGIASELQYFAAAATLIFFLGIKDDILVLSVTKKFIGQLIAAGIIIKFGGVRITDMHGFLGMNQIPPVASIVLSLLTIILITNSFNLIDGVDGLAGSLGLLTTILFGTYFFYAGQLMYGIMAFSLAGSTLAFLIYNFSPAKIFMGDTGSLLLGLINSILVIKFINIAGSPVSNFPIQSVPALGFAILMIPLFDTLRVFTIRILNRRSPFSPDRNHVHHFLLDLGLNHKMVTLTCVGANIVFIGLAFAMRNMGTTTTIASLLVLAFLFMGIIYYYSRLKTRQMQQLGGATKTKIVSTHKVLSLAIDSVEVE